MFKIIRSTSLASDIQKITIEAPKIASKRKPGQFLILRIDEFGERIPLTIFSTDLKAGTITVIVQGIGKTSKTLNNMQAGQFIKDVAGPLGVPSEIKYYGTVVIMGGGLGTAVAYPTAKALKDAGNYIISIIGYRTYDLVVLEGEMMNISDECYITTDDGSYGLNGFCTDKLQALIDSNKKIDLVHTAGPLPMMRATANVTRPYKIHTVASLNPIMIDGTGMCGGCRVIVDNKIFFACVDGPDFNAHEVDFDNLMKRNQAYREFEQAVDIDHTCNYEKVFD